MPDDARTVLITGGGGFVGSHVVRHIIENTDWHVVVIDSFRHRGVTDRLRVQMKDHAHEWERVEVYTHDLRAPISQQLDAAIGDVDYVLHLASESHVDRSIEAPRDFIENNVAVTLTMLEWLRTRKLGGYHFDHEPVKMFVQISTDEVYGPAYGDHLHSEGESHRPSNPYSASKAAQEDICFAYWRTYGLPILISNTMNIIGELQDPEKFVPMVIRKTLLGERVTLHGRPDGTTGSRFYLHARNQADALLHLLMSTLPYMWTYRDHPEMPRLNVVGDEEMSNYELWHKIVTFVRMEGYDVARIAPEIVDFHSSRPGHDLRYALDGSKLRALGWKPPVSLTESLRKTVQWTLDHREWLGIYDT